MKGRTIRDKVLLRCLAGLLVLLFVAWWAAQAQTKKPEILLQPVEEGSGTAFILTTNGADGDEAIVQICYWIDFPNTSPQKIVRCHDSVTPVVNGTGVVVDSVPAPISEIMRVRVRIVRDVYEQNFPYKETR
jgi:hypothetical protein